MSSITLLGPQRVRSNLAETLAFLEATGPVAVITAGWEEREDELEVLHATITQPTINLRLHARLEHALAQDEPLREAWQRRNERLLTMQQLYRRRLDHALQVVWEFQQMLVEEMELLIQERASALRAVAALDAHYLDEIRTIHGAFVRRWKPRERPAVGEIREELKAELAQCGTILIAGGNVGTLIDPMRLFSIVELLDQQSIVAWSAGAMVLCERIVFFHDSPPQGRGNPEVYDDGLALCPQLVALPDGSLRLRLNDPVRVETFARRFAPATCVVLDPGSGLRWDGGGWTALGSAKRLSKTGKVQGMAAP